MSSLKPDNLKDLHVDIILGLAEEALSSEFTAELKYISGSVVLLSTNVIHWKHRLVKGKNIKLISRNIDRVWLFKAVLKHCYVINVFNIHSYFIDRVWLFSY